MDNKTALSSAKNQRQRGFFSRVLLAPLSVGVFVSFLAGVGTIGWFKTGQVKPEVAESRVVASYQISVPEMPAAPVIADAGMQVFDYRGSGRGISENPRPLRQAIAALAQLPSADEIEALQEIAPAAGPALSASLNAPAYMVRPQGRLQGQVRVAIVIDDLGPSYRDSMAAISLPEEITLAFLPYAERLTTLTARARAAGHEMLVHMPMEPENMAHNNPGPQALTVNLTADQIRQRVSSALDSFEGHVGLNNHMGSRFTANTVAMQAVLGELARRNQIFFDSRTTPRSVGAEVAASIGLQFAGRDVFLDNEQNIDLITAQLHMLERLARSKGHASAIGHPYPETIAAIKAWLPGAKSRGVQIVPVSHLAQRLGMSAVSAEAR